jgi:hypothetical protein
MSDDSAIAEAIAKGEAKRFKKLGLTRRTVDRTV